MVQYFDVLNQKVEEMTQETNSNYYSPNDLRKSNWGEFKWDI